MAGTGQRRAAYGVYYFSVEIDGMQEAVFRSCSGLKSEAEVVIVQEGGVNSADRKLIGHTKLANIVLKQGFSNSMLWEKRLQYVNDDTQTPIKRFSGTIYQHGAGGVKAHSWQFRDGWICKWEGPEFDASKNELSIESIEIAHEGLEYKAVQGNKNG